MPAMPKGKKTYKRYTKKAKASFASKVKAVIHKEAETKFHIISGTESTVYGNTLTSPSNYTRLNNVAEGSTENERVGNKIRPFLLNLRGSIQSNSLKPIITKLYVLATNAVNDPRLDLLEDNAGIYAPATQDLGAVYARINTNKYKVLKTIYVKTGTYANHVGDYGGTKLFNVTMKLNGVYEYTDGTSICNRRSIIMVPIFREAQNDTTTGETIELTYNAKLYYKDL